MLKLPLHKDSGGKLKARHMYKFQDGSNPIRSELLTTQINCKITHLHKIQMISNILFSASNETMQSTRLKALMES